MRVASDKTALANERRHSKRLQQEVNTLKIASAAYRERATKAEQEVAEWKRRFDLLLVRSPNTSTAEPT